MGYYTNFTIKMDPAGGIIDCSADPHPLDNEEFEKVLENLEEISGYNEWYPDAKCCGVFHIMQASWYGHEENMTTLSVMHPHILFTLDGYGEAQGDIWRMYFRNGKKQLIEAEITYGPFDISKLY